jgi:hypothetical protein
MPVELLKLTFGTWLIAWHGGDCFDIPTATRGSDDETVKSVKDWIYEGQAILEEGVYWNRFVSTSLREASTGDEDEETAYDTAE